MTRIILTTGGTGGHIFPALAVAEALRRLEPEADLLFMGGAGPEGELATKAGLPFIGLPAKGVFGRGLRALAAPFWMARAFGLAVSHIRTFTPDVVAGFGGYAGFIPVAAARLMGVPTAIHEQNSVPGVTNKVLGRVVDRIYVTYPDTTGAFPAKRTVRLGNPIRAGIAAPSPAHPGSKHLLVLGGSQGARAINDAVMAILPQLLDAGVKVRLQAGRADFDRIGAHAADILAGRPHLGGGPDVVIENFIDDMAAAYAWADLVLARAGATTLAEVTAAGKPSFLIPFPFATHDHQSVNAAFLAKAGAAEVVAQSALPGFDLAGALVTLLADPDRLAAMGRAAANEALPDAAERIAAALLGMAVKKGELS
ncbi:UDP-N-acetylglucosamine--N-acetylmuramyl-(pentapeptide) pyrophosphoryl-undecaprenol N-acetylglucosamine transferase [Desulfovibrio sp. DV]|uniref:undecaprenyldiphospho-muramoylpentapeptide beta-N-acetylglucosaminyltransferase n=1 Tax=Desulfovibrio sp. DV TaxID=1844708 RepID=UPI00094B8A2E|nr:undecaprenyldiphospho-muramoylpentapeptide beta-N-acetylglucosaminyltransferase [Desulfovibrio sp. DV]OLN25840.1 UDP-N-acetylglucosamine--N-acetylmuramyl-(pentapeptide) pyrophosphoryl-undecaprenol N-acetylglucosamine transferase [Desulfovibrio sp. DV]